MTVLVCVILLFIILVLIIKIYVIYIKSIDKIFSKFMNMNYNLFFSDISYFRNFQYSLIFMNFILNLSASLMILASTHLYDSNFIVIGSKALNIIFVLSLMDCCMSSHIKFFLIFCSRFISLLCIFLNRCSIPHKFSFLLTMKITIYLHADIHSNYLMVSNHYIPNSTLNQKPSKTPSQLSSLLCLSSTVLYGIHIS